MGKSHHISGDPPVPDMKASKRVVVGRNISLTAGVVYALSRAAYYATINPDATSKAQDVLTGNGRLLGAWAALWGIAAVLCVVDMVNRHTRYGLSLVAGVACGWGIAYAVMWAVTGFTDPSLISTSIGWLTPGALVMGFVIKVAALQDLLRASLRERD